MKIVPLNGYVLGKEIVKDTGVVTDTDTSDTHQRYEIIDVSPFYVDHGQEMDIGEKFIGKSVIILKHAAEGDTPLDLYNQGIALFHFTRIMAIEEEK